jgi:hypothetical protein
MKFFLKIYGFIILFIFGYLLIEPIPKYAKSMSKVNSFKKSCVYNEELSSSSIEYYERDEGIGRPFDDIQTPGLSLDIIITFEPYANIPVLYDICYYTIGGHAAIVCADYQTDDLNIGKRDMIETALNNTMSKTSISDRYGFFELAYNEYVVLRVNLTQVENREVFNEAISYKDDPYNASFMFNTFDTKYCSDLVSAAFKKANINLNKDGGPTTMYDILASNDTYVVMAYQYDNGIKRYYYVK